MKKLFAIFSVVILAVALVGAHPARAQPVFFGDFVVTDSAIDTGVTMFDSGLNPLPFPQPSPIQQANTYPAVSAGNITVGEIQTFLDGAGLPNDTVGFCWVIAPNGAVGIASLVITIGGVPAAVSDGVIIIDSLTYFIPELDLDSWSPTDEVLFSYDTFTTTEDVVRIDLAATPEPVSLVFM